MTWTQFIVFFFAILAVGGRAVDEIFNIIEQIGEERRKR